MTVGLLICDHVNPEYRAQFGDYREMFSELFPELDFTFYDATKGEFPDDLETCDAYMGTGSRYSVYDDKEWIKEALDFVRRIHLEKKCFVGICFSHQLIGEALGGKVEKSDQGWCVGVQQFDPLGLNLLMMCQDQIVELPTEAEVLAGSALCPNGIIQIGNHILGIQAHPEFTKAYDRLLMEARIKRMGDETVKEGIKSLNMDVDREGIRNYILNFIQNAL